MNPFTQRERITDPERFAGRWREVGMVFERIEARRPVLLTGARGTGKSSLLTHVGQSAGAVL
ncbi:MAG: AAA family ATPase, partial [Chloroflexaceae bacterium]